MHFLVVTFCFIMGLLSGALLLYVVVETIDDIRFKRWKWLPIHAVTIPVLVAIVYHFVDLLCKL